MVTKNENLQGVFTYFSGFISEFRSIDDRYAAISRGWFFSLSETFYKLVASLLQRKSRETSAVNVESWKLLFIDFVRSAIDTSRYRAVRSLKRAGYSSRKFW